MNTREFLTAVWPKVGPYCLAIPFTIPGTTKSVYAHKVVDTFSEAMSYVLNNRDTKDIFFAVHTLEQPFIINPNKLNRKTNKLGAKEYRTHANMKESRAFFFDLDIGPEEGKYQTRDEALSDLQMFLFVTGLPDPLVTSSGGGFHVYWTIADAIPSLKWRTIAGLLHGLALYFGMRHDPMRTTDQSSVLRVAGTFNLKGGQKRPVEVLHDGKVSPNAAFIDQIKSLAAQFHISEVSGPHERAGATPGDRKPGEIGPAVYDGRVTGFEELYDACGNARYFANSLGVVPEPIWYNSLGLIQFTRGGYELMHHFSSGHASYNPADTDAKVAQFNSKSDGPPSCKKLDQVFGAASACATCPLAAKGHNPLIIANRAKDATPAPPPVLPPTLMTLSSTSSIVEPPAPWSRVSAGIQYKYTDKEKKVHTPTILQYDFFPIADYKKTELEMAFSIWIAKLPQEGHIVIKMLNKDIYDQRALSSTLTNHGVYIQPKYLTNVRDFMSAYIRRLQEHQRANKQYDHLGWTDGHTRFIMPTKMFCDDGTEHPTSLSGIAQSAGLWVRTKGSLAAQVKNLEFYNDDKYLRQQFAILCGLASPLMFATGLGGAVVSLSGDSGASKSTTLYAAAALYGPPKDYVIDATQDGSTHNARNTRAITLANLPLCLDEMTNLTPEQIRAFVFHVSQYQDRGRLNPDGTPKPSRAEAKSMLAIVTSNNSLHHLLSVDNSAGIAGAVRVFEIPMVKIVGGDKVAADAFLRDLDMNHGHIGEVFIKGIMPHVDIVRKAVNDQTEQFDTMWKLDPAERYLSSISAAATTAGRIGKKAGLIPFNISKIVQWLTTEAIPTMRLSIGDEVQQLDPAGIVSSYLEHIDGEMVRVNHCRYSPLDPFTELRELKSFKEIKAHLDIEAQVVYVRKDAFRDWCNHKNKNAAAIITALHRAGVVGRMDVKFTLGRDTDLAKGRSNCFTIILSAIGGVVTPVTSRPAPAANVVPIRKGLPKQPPGMPVAKPNIP